MPGSDDEFSDLEENLVEEEEENHMELETEIVQDVVHGETSESADMEEDELQGDETSALSPLQPRDGITWSPPGSASPPTPTCWGNNGHSRESSQCLSPHFHPQPYIYHSHGEQQVCQGSDGGGEVFQMGTNKRGGIASLPGVLHSDGHQSCSRSRGLLEERSSPAIRTNC